jgi:PAS domain S-box-containing protein
MAVGLPELVERSFQALAVPAFVLSFDRVIVEVNRRFEVVTGRSRADVVGRPTSAMRAPGTDWGPADRMDAALAAGQDWDGELLGYRADGAEVWNEVAIRRLDGDEVFFVATLVDLTDAVQRRRRGEDRGEVGCDRAQGFLFAPAIPADIAAVVVRSDL